MTGRQRAEFVVRDGVLNVDHGHVHQVEDFEWLPGAVQALRRLQADAYALVVVTNQSVIVRGMSTEADFARLHKFVYDDLQRQSVRLTGVYACPHHPQATVEAYRPNCDCRKPRPGLILRACAECGLDAARSCLFGGQRHRSRSRGRCRALLAGRQCRRGHGLRCRRPCHQPCRRVAGPSRGAGVLTPAFHPFFRGLVQ